MDRLYNVHGDSFTVISKVDQSEKVNIDEISTSLRMQIGYSLLVFYVKNLR